MAETIFRVDRFDSKPVPFEILQRTARTLWVGKPGYGKTRVFTSEVGHKWFLAEREAWEAIAASHRRAIQHAQQTAAREQRELDVVEAVLHSLEAAAPQDGTE